MRIARIAAALVLLAGAALLFLALRPDGDGYDASAEPARLEVAVGPADTPGRFDLEAHGRWETIAQLVVEP